MVRVGSISHTAPDLGSADWPLLDTRFGGMAAVSARALIMLGALDESFAYVGINPEHISDTSRIDSFGC